MTHGVAFEELEQAEHEAGADGESKTGEDHDIDGRVRHGAIIAPRASPEGAASGRDGHKSRKKKPPYG